MRAATDLEFWNFRDTTQTATRIQGFDVEGADGYLGWVEEAIIDVGASYVLVRTKRQPEGPSVAVPAAMVRWINVASRTIFVELWKDLSTTAADEPARVHRSDRSGPPMPPDYPQGVARPGVPEPQA